MRSRDGARRGGFARDPARRRHRLGQDRGLFRGRRRGAAAGPAGADPDAGDRADRRSSSSASPAASASRPAEWHSDVSAPPARAGLARRRDGEVQVVVGARSALFLPFPDLGLIVVDEEHEAAYKQEDGVVYHARDMAVVRGRLENAAGGARLGDALASRRRVNAERGRYRAARSAGPLRRRAAAGDRGDRHARATRRRAAASVAAAGRRRSTRRSRAGEQALLFLNRRGYAPLTLCRTCGHRFQCPNCSAWLVEHRFRGALRLPPLRPCRAAAGRLPELRRRRAAWSPSGRASSGSPRRSRRASRGAHASCCRATCPAAPSGCGGARGDRDGRGRHRHRHPARRQGPQFPAA